MLVLTTIPSIRARREEVARAGKRLAFVPTMGALHEGHLSLVRRARELADEVWASVFVNPAQFGPSEDFASYPRDLERDRDLLERDGATLLFAPSTREIYPRPPATVVDLPELTAGLCGASPPRSFSRGGAGRRQALQHRPAKGGGVRRQGLAAGGGRPSPGRRTSTCRCASKFTPRSARQTVSPCPRATPTSPRRSAVPLRCSRARLRQRQRRFATARSALQNSS